jgi:beta-lactamase class A
MRTVLVLGLCLIAAKSGQAADPGPLDSKLHELISAHKGKVAVALKHLGTGETFFDHADDVMPTASLIKLPVMAEVYFQAEAGKIKLDDMVTLTKDEMVQGSGILTDHFSPGAKFSLRDAVHLMIVYSDNTATNLVLDKIGIKPVNDRMAGLGLKETRINAKVFKGSTTSVDPARTKQYGLGSTTAREMLTLLEMLDKGELVSADASKAMLEHMKKCEDKDKFPRFLPKGVTVAHKTGSVSDARTDAGLLYFKEGPVALVILTNGNQDKSWTPDNAGNKLCADAAKAVVDFYQRAANKPGDPKR